MDRIEEGDLALFITWGKKGMRKLLRTIRSGEKLHTHAGTIDYDQLIGMPWGSKVKTNVGKEVVVLQPSTADLMEKLPRRTQITYPKDAGYMILRAGIGPGSLVVEGGTGSGAMALCLSRIVGEEGRVFSYEVNKDFLKVARRNLARAGASNVVLKNKDMREGIDEEGVDAVFLDLGDPWEVFPHARKALKPGGALCVIVPSFEQMKRVVVEAEANGFLVMECLEVLLRHYDVSAQRTRPSPRMVGHTVFVIIMRKVEPTPEEENLGTPQPS